MNRFFSISGLLVSLFIFQCVALAGEGVPDPEEWYSESYGTLWVAEPWNKTEEIAGCYAEEIRSHETSGEVSAYATGPWLTGLFEEWRAEGWVSSELSGISTDRVHAGMVVIKAQWRDFYAEQDADYSCGWYVAKYRDERWQITDYATIDCAEHGF